MEHAKGVVAFVGTVFGSTLICALIWVGFSEPVWNGFFYQDKLWGMDQSMWLRNAGFMCVVLSGGVGFLLDDA